MGALSDSWRMSADPPQLANGWDAAINNIGGRLPQLSDGAAPQAAPLDDPLSAYPAAARERVVELRQRADDLFAAVDAAASKREEARQALQYAEAAMRRLRGAHSMDGFQMPADAEVVVQQQRTVDAARERLDRALAHCAAVTANWTPLDIVVRAIDDFINRSAGAEIRPYPGPKATLGKGETFATGVARVRAKIAELRAEASSVQAAPVDRGEQIKKMEAEIDHLSERGRPSVNGGAVSWPLLNVRLETFLRTSAGRGSDGFCGGEILDGIGLTCFLHGPALKAALRGIIETDATTRDALTSAQRETRLREIASEILDQDRREADLVAQGEAEGFVIAFRGDIDPRAILNIELA